MFFVVMKNMKTGPSYVYGPFFDKSEAWAEYEKRAEFWAGTDQYIIDITESVRV